MNLPASTFAEWLVGNWWRLRWEPMTQRTGRRFEAAGLLADRMVVHKQEALRPATSAHTYRQRMQRAFAAEFLCPVESLVECLPDFSDEARQRAARRFAVSPLAVTSQLVNNAHLRRDELRDPDLEAA